MNFMRKLGKYGMLLSVMCLGLSLRAGSSGPSSTPEQRAEQVSAGQKVMNILRACISDTDKKTSFKEFVAQMIQVLEEICKNPDKLKTFQTEFPNLNIQALILALKKVQLKTSAILIGFDLKPFFKSLPQDLQDVNKLYNGIDRRLAIK